jgi:hypothetical protein
MRAGLITKTPISGHHPLHNYSLYPVSGNFDLALFITSKETVRTHLMIIEMIIVDAVNIEKVSFNRALTDVERGRIVRR